LSIDRQVVERRLFTETLTAMTLTTTTAQRL